MTGADSTIYVYWLHPDLNRYNLRLSEEMPGDFIFPGTEPGEYIIGQRNTIPGIIIQDCVNVTVQDGGYDQPVGAHYDRLDFCLFSGSSVPNPAPMAIYGFYFEGKNADGTLCLKADINHFFIGQNDIWSGVKWDFDSPDTPRLRAASNTYDYFGFNKIGIGNGGTYAWQNISSQPYIENHIYSVFPLDSLSIPGQLKKDISPNTPEYFRVSCYREESKIEYYCYSDTLIWATGLKEVDSVIIEPGNGEILYEEPARLVYNDIMRLPVIQLHQSDSIFFSGPEEYIEIKNISTEDISIRINCLNPDVEISPDSLKLFSGQTVELSINAKKQLLEPIETTVLIDPEPEEYYPQIWELVCLPDDYSAVSDNDLPAVLPNEFALAGPNPFSEMTPVVFKIMTPIRAIEIFNILGQRVRDFYPALGVDQITWSGSDQDGRILPCGVYLARVEDLGGNVEIKRLILFH